MNYSVYEDTPRYDPWFKLILAGTLALTMVLGIVLIPVNVLAAEILFGTTVFDALIFHAFVPRRYQIFPDRVRVVLGRPFAFSIALSSIREARPASGSKAFAYRGLRFATSVNSVVEIVRHRGWNLVISPAHRDLFLEQLNEALKTADLN